MQVYQISGSLPLRPPKESPLVKAWFFSPGISVCLVFMQDVNVLRMTSHSRYNENVRNGLIKRVWEGSRGSRGGRVHPDAERAAEGFSGDPVGGSPPARAGDTGSAPWPRTLRAAQLVRHSSRSPRAGARALQEEKPLQGEACTARKSSSLPRARRN